MDAERLRELALKLPHAVEGVSFGHQLVFWVGHKTIGGKMFAMTDLDLSGAGVMSLCAGPERFHELIESEGIIPAPYMARMFWVTVTRWNALPDHEFARLLESAHALTYAKLPPRTKAVLAMAPKERTTLIKARKKLLGDRKKLLEDREVAAPADAVKSARKKAATKQVTAKKSGKKKA